WAVDVHRLDGPWPTPDERALAAASAQVEALADGTRVIADALAFAALPALAQAHAERLRWVALVHHPLHLETGLAAVARSRLRHSETRALQCSRQVVVTSASTAADVAAMGVAPARIAVVEPGTDPLPRPADVRAADRSGPVRLLCVATLTPRKGHAVLLQALTQLGTLDWVLHGVGSLTRDPETAARVMAFSASPMLSGRVRWHGEVDAATLQAHYAAADLLVLPSLHEGYGMVVAEALAAGLPVLATSAGALAHTVPADAGLQVPPGDAQALQAALARLITEPGLRARLAAGARAAARRLPTWDEQAARFGTVLQGVA
ncbi:MAG TPA: glycosyltransferase family 4 protein, partial [Rubrivivax sp.]|nr:glycosyltransferase family 4 protein [Rubrivivax sp.]